jgi:hypothetical protein
LRFQGWFKLQKHSAELVEQKSAEMICLEYWQNEMIWIIGYDGRGSLKETQLTPKVSQLIEQAWLFAGCCVSLRSV